jgi:anti-anti-sigma factor
VTSALTGITAALRAAVPATAHAGILRGDLSAWFPPGPPAHANVHVLDHVQAEPGHGPGVAVLREHRPVTITDRHTDHRRPLFSAKARQLGGGAVLNLPLVAANRSLGVLTLYALADLAFTPDDATIAGIFATHAARVLLAADDRHHLAESDLPAHDADTRSESRTAVAQLWESPDTPSVGLDLRYAPCLTLVALSGEIDICTVPYLRKLLLPVAGEVVNDVEVDMARVSFMACAGLYLLLELRARLAGTGATLRLTGATPAIRRLITLTDLQALLPC